MPANTSKSRAMSRKRKRYPPNAEKYYCIKY